MVWNNAFEMNGYQILDYLSSPLQASLYVADHVTDEDSAVLSDPSMRQVLSTVTPTFFGSVENEIREGFRQGLYGPDLDLQRRQNANSPFADILTRDGALALLVVPLVVFAAARTVVKWRQGSLPHITAAGALCYALSELWRTYLFTAGILIFVLIVTLGIRHSRPSTG